MLADLGFFLLFSCLVISCYGAVASFCAARWRHRKLYRSARMAVTLNALLCVSAAIILWFLFFQRDYSVAYIFKNSSNDLPTFYRFTAFWSSLEGSHLLWTLLLSLYAGIASWTYNKDNEHIMPFVTGSLQLVLAWMFYLLVSHSDPFVRTLPAHGDGYGMNALLQNFYMAIHPPLLFNGYTALAIPAAYSIAALCHGDITQGWLRTVRRWTLCAWCFLTAGIVLGGRWAYVELGWAGYWAWDPVENSSFLPWLLCTAMLHSLIVQEKLGHLKRLTIVLAFLAFFSSFFGTFITRSGIVSSVHSFAESPIGPNYLMFLAVMLLLASALYAWRAPSILPSETSKVWGVSKESALVVTQFLLLTFAIIVCVGTLYPIVSEWITGERTSVQAPYFNTFAPWIGLGLIGTVAVGNLMRFQTSKIPNGKKIMVGAAIAAVPVTLLFLWLGEVLPYSRGFGFAAQLVGSYLCFWAFWCLVADVWQRLADLRYSWKLFFQRNLAFFGAFIAHVGAIIAILGFLGNYRGLETVATLKQNESAELYGYRFEFQNLDVGELHNMMVYSANVAVYRDNQLITTMKPARSKYPTAPELHHEVSVYGQFWYDLYITLSDFDKSTGQRVTLEIHVNPTVRFVWIATVIMVLGGLIAACDQLRGLRSRDNLDSGVNANI